jgi:hypothetical protein
VTIETVNQMTYDLRERILRPRETEVADLEIEIQKLRQGLYLYMQGLGAYLQDAEVVLEGNPYKEPRTYSLGDANRFGGRNGDIQRLLSLIRDERLSVFHSETGAGKSSLLMAGITPRLLQAGHLPAHLRPYDRNPTTALKDLFLADLKVAPQQATEPLDGFLRHTSAILGPDTVLFVFIDQFEEYFTRLPEEHQVAFIDELADCVNDRSLQTHWVLSTPTEYFGRLAVFRPRIDPGKCN